MKPRGTRSYSQREIAIIRALLLTGRPVGVIAAAINRPIGGIYKKIRDLGWSSIRWRKHLFGSAPAAPASAPEGSKTDTKRRWTSPEVMILHALLKRGRSYELIASVMPGRNVEAITAKAKRMGWAPGLKGRNTFKVRNGALIGPTRDITRKGRAHDIRRVGKVHRRVERAARIISAPRC